MTSRLITRGRKDANQKEIVSALRAMGATVFILDRPVDLLVGWRGKNLLIEIKDGSLKPSARRLTSDEKEFFDTWRGSAYVVESVEDAIRLLNLLT